MSQMFECGYVDVDDKTKNLDRIFNLMKKGHFDREFTVRFTKLNKKVSFMVRGQIPDNMVASYARAFSPPQEAPPDKLTEGKPTQEKPPEKPTTTQ